MVDLDNIFKYAAPKYVYIRDAKLGILKYTFMLGIFGYVVVYDIIYSCSHLKPHHATGFGSIALSEPAEKCDPFDAACEPEFDTIDSLKYCTQYKGRRMESSERVGKSEGDIPEDLEEKFLSRHLASAGSNSSKKGSTKGNKSGPAIGDYLTKPRTCRYVDNMRLAWEPSVMSEIFIPTHFHQIKQKINPKCYNPESDAPPKKYDCDQPWTTVEEKDYYVADIGEFHLAIEHSFNAPSLGMFGTSTSIQGFFAACDTNKPMSMRQVKAKCKRMKVPDSVGETAPEDLEGLTTPKEMGVDSLKAGFGGADAITLNDLLKLTPVAQKHDIKSEVLDRKLPDDFGHPKESLREKGGILMLDVNYDNTALLRPGFGLPSWAIKPVTYTYRAHFFPAAENLKYQLVQQGDSSNNRVVDMWYGLSIRMTFNGELVKFQASKLLTAMTTGLVLLATASTIVTMLALYVLPLKEKYLLLMYQYSEDFSDYVGLKSFMKGKKSESMYWVGQYLLDKLEGVDHSGNSISKEIEPDKLKQILCTYEMRLNRLDGMDPLVVFEEGSEVDSRSYAIGDAARAFYQDEMGLDDNAISGMSYRLQKDKREAIPAGQGIVFENNAVKYGKLA